MNKKIKKKYRGAFPTNVMTAMQKFRNYIGTECQANWAEKIYFDIHIFMPFLVLSLYEWVLVNPLYRLSM
jgi:hypothetical protein